MNELPTDQPIVCICRSGNRSRFACEELAAAGFENVINLEWRHVWLANGRTSRSVNTSDKLFFIN